jgi:hypothetical protein
MVRAAFMWQAYRVRPICRPGTDGKVSNRTQAKTYVNVGNRVRRKQRRDSSTKVGIRS